MPIVGSSAWYLVALADTEQSQERLANAGNDSGSGKVNRPCAEQQVTETYTKHHEYPETKFQKVFC